MQKPKASIIIPVYNAEKYLEECVQSALNQTYSNYEIILINDGSSDKSFNIMEGLYHGNDRKIKIYDQKNVGVAITRNRGIEYSSGDYLFFMDNDDYLDHDYIERFIQEAIESDADYVLGEHKQIEKKGKKIIKRTLTDDEWSAFRFLTPWARVYKKQFLIENDIRFLDTKMGEEIYCSILAAVYAKKVSILHYSGYNWRVDENSVSHTLQKGFQKVASPIKLLNSIYESIEMKKLSKKKYEQLEYFYVKYCIWYMLDSGRGVGRQSMRDEYKEIFGILKKKFPDYKKNKLIKITKPVGETFLTRAIVWFIVKISKIKLDRIIFELYALL